MERMIVTWLQCEYNFAQQFYPLLKKLPFIQKIYSINQSINPFIVSIE